MFLCSVLLSETSLSITVIIILTKWHLVPWRAVTTIVQVGTIFFFFLGEELCYMKAVLENWKALRVHWNYIEKLFSKTAQLGL